MWPPTRSMVDPRGLSSVGRALPLQGRCQEFESPRLHKHRRARPSVHLTTAHDGHPACRVATSPSARACSGALPYRLRVREVTALKITSSSTAPTSAPRKEC